MRNNFKISILISVLTLVFCFSGQSQQAAARLSGDSGIKMTAELVTPDGKPLTGQAIKETLLSDKPLAFNTIANPKLIFPVSSTVRITGKKISTNLDPESVNVFNRDFKTR